MRMMPYWRHKGGGQSCYGLAPFSNRLDQLFDLAWPWQPFAGTLLENGPWAPALDIRETKEHIQVQADLPGLNKEDMEVLIRDNRLILKGEKKSESQDKSQGCLRSERVRGRFLRVLDLSVDVDAGKAQATYQDGVLTLTLPKKKEAAPKPVRIDIK